MTMDILEKLNILENESRKLEPEPILRNHWRKSVSDYSDSFLDNIEQIKAYVVSEDRGRDIYNTPIGEPKTIEAMLVCFLALRALCAWKINSYTGCAPKWGIQTLQAETLARVVL